MRSSPAESEEEEFVLISPDTIAGERFVQAVQARGLPFAVLTNLETEAAAMAQSGIRHVIKADTRSREAAEIPSLPIGKVFLFERSLPLTCRYLQICRPWTSRPICVIASGRNPRMIYKGLGADYTIYSRGEDVSFLIARHL